VTQAGPRYLEIVTPHNTALQKFQDAAHANKPWRDLRPLAGGVAQANAAQAQALRQTSWPAEVATPMATLLTEIDLALAADMRTLEPECGRRPHTRGILHRLQRQRASHLADSR
jgi:hypothetical protein